MKQVELEQMLQSMRQQRERAFTAFQQANGAIQVLEHLLTQLENEPDEQPEEDKSDEST